MTDVHYVNFRLSFWENNLKLSHAFYYLLFGLVSGEKKLKFDLPENCEVNK